MEDLSNFDKNYFYLLDVYKNDLLKLGKINDEINQIENKIKNISSEIDIFNKKMILENNKIIIIKCSYSRCNNQIKTSTVVNNSYFILCDDHRQKCNVCSVKTKCIPKNDNLIYNTNIDYYCDKCSIYFNKKINTGSDMIKYTDPMLFVKYKEISDLNIIKYSNIEERDILNKGIFSKYDILKSMFSEREEILERENKKRKREYEKEDTQKDAQKQKKFKGYCTNKICQNPLYEGDILCKKCNFSYDYKLCDHPNCINEVVSHSNIYKKYNIYCKEHMIKCFICKKYFRRVNKKALNLVGIEYIKCSNCFYKIL